MEIRVASDASVLVVLGDQPGEAVHRRVAWLTQKLLAMADAPIRNVHPAYSSVLVDFDPLRTTHDEIAAMVHEIEMREDSADLVEPRVVEIPVCYGGEFGPDLENVARHLGILAEEVVRRHAAGTYYVSFFGFSPGYAYLGGLDSSLQMPRLDSPRRLVRAGSVAIAGAQSGVYPVESPGGWRVLGRTPMRMFDPDATKPSPLEVGDRVRFVPISREAFDRLSAERHR